MGCGRRGLAKPATQVLGHSVRGRAVEAFRKMCWMRCSSISPKTIQIRMRRSADAGAAHPMFCLEDRQQVTARDQRSLLL